MTMTIKKPRSKSVTSHDVARLAGVSRAAVSRSFTPNASVSAETREKVYKAAKEVGYRVNYLARSLINQRSDLVGLVAAGMDNPFRSMQIEQLSRALIAKNFRPVLLPAPEKDDPSWAIEQLLHYSVSGVLVTSDAPPTALCEECAAAGVPIVLINKGDDMPFVDRVVSDDKTAGRLAAEHLIGIGVKRPGMMAASPISYTARRRAEAFTARCLAMGVPATSIELPINDYAHGFEFAGTLEAQGIDGLFCANDYMACGVIDRLRRDGSLSGSKPIRIIGHDDIPQARWDAYQLTTIVQPCDVQAEQAVALLISRMEQPDLTARVAFTDVRLISRRTA